MTILEWMFVALFSIETLLRMSAYRFCFFFDKHNLLDLALVVMMDRFKFRSGDVKETSE